MLRIAAVLIAVLGVAACEGMDLGSGSSTPQTAGNYPSGRWGTPSPVYRNQTPVYPQTDPWGRSTARAYPGSPVYGSGSSVPRRGAGIRILDARYVAENGRSCDAEAKIARACDGEGSCRIEASNELCGDPQKGAGKMLIVQYSCGRSRLEARARQRDTVTLAC